MKLRNMVGKCINGAKEVGSAFLHKKSKGIDGILVTIGLCILALLLVVVMKEPLSTFITTLVGDLTTEAQNILGITTTT